MTSTFFPSNWKTSFPCLQLWLEVVCAYVSLCASVSLCTRVTSRATATRLASIPSCEMCDSFLFCLLIIIVVLSTAVQLNSLYYVIREGR
jgi:hypothetical protein